MPIYCRLRFYQPSATVHAKNKKLTPVAKPRIIDAKPHISNICLKTIGIFDGNISNEMANAASLLLHSDLTFDLLETHTVHAAQARNCCCYQSPFTDLCVFNLSCCMPACQEKCDLYHIIWVS